MDSLTHNVFLFFASAAAQVWSALMVFHILLIRDLKHQIEREIDGLWAYARSWWPKLLASMKDKASGGLRARLNEFGLDPETILRADTHKNSFIRLIAAIKAHKIVSMHGLAPGVINEQELTAAEWQLKFEPIADRITELESENADTSSAFYLGIGAIAFNLAGVAVNAIGSVPSWGVEAGVAFWLLANLVFLGTFVRLVRRSLHHFNRTAAHDQLSEQILDLQKKSTRSFRRRQERERKAG